MDTLKLSEIFDSLKSLLGTHRSGEQWGSGGGAPRPRSSMWGIVPEPTGLEQGADEAEIVAVAEETRLIVQGLSGQRLKRKDQFVASAEIVHADRPHLLGGSMVIDGRQVYLVQTLIAHASWLVGQRCLLAATPEHVGRLIKIAYKLADGLNYQVCHRIPKPYQIVRHGAGWLELDRPVESHGTGYLVCEF